MKFGHLLPILFFATLHINTMQAQWTNLGSGIAAPNHSVFGIAAVDEEVIWAISSAYPTPNDHLVRSTDGGATWSAAPFNIDAGLFAIQLFPVDDMNAWLATADEENPISGKIYRTTDGGATWEEQSTGFTEFNETPAAVHFWNADEGVAFGATCYDDYTDQIAIYTTDDGGENWEKVNGDAMPAQLPGEGMCIYSGNGFYDVVGDNIWFVSSGNRVFRSTDRGRNWEAFLVSGSGSLSSLAFKDELNGLAARLFPNEAFRTSDGGETWTPIGIPDATFAAAIEYIPGTEGTYLVHNGTAPVNNATMFLTFDSGNTWEEFTSNVNLDCLQFLSPSIGFGGGRVNSETSGGMYKWEGFSLSGPIYVNDDATGANDGSTWEDAYTDLQDALAAAEEGGELWVAEGVYRPAGAGGSRSASFVLDKNLKLYGGFAGTESSLEERGDPADFLTMLSGDLNGNDVEDNLTMNRTDNVLTVLTVGENVTDEAVIDGFTISGGHANGGGENESARKSGGGLYVLGRPTVEHCRFEQNYAAWRGGGAYFVNTAGLAIENNRFEHNECGNLGGGLNVESAPLATLAIRECEFRDNAAIRGGGLNIQNSNCTVEDCTFLYNMTPQHGGGMRYDATTAGQSIELTGSYLEGNASSIGGGVFMEARSNNNSFGISDCQFTENFAYPLQEGWGQSGGGATIVIWPGQQNNTVVFENSEFLRNASTWEAGGLSLLHASKNSHWEFRNLIFRENTSDIVAGAMIVTGDYEGTGEVLVDDCHFEDNRSEVAGALQFQVGYADVANLDFILMASTLIANEAAAGGALGLQVNQGSVGDFLVENCIIDGNSASERGGAIVLNPHSGDYSATIRRTHIINNQSPDGGAIEAYQSMDGSPFPEGASCLVENSLIARNSSSNAAISMELFPGLELLNTTVADNTGGGVELAGGSGLTLQNTILYNPEGTEFTDLFDDASVTSNGGNLIGDSSLDEWLNGMDKPSTDPLFDADHHLMEGSPAIDAGVAYEGMPELDLAGNDRMQGNGLDIGAYESSFVSGAREALAEAPLGLAPNPASAFLRVELPVTAQGAFHAQVMDAQGRMVARELIRNGELLDVEGLPQGMYLVKALVDGVVYAGRFVKQ